MTKFSFSMFLVFILISILELQAKDYYFHPKSGNDNHLGNAIDKPLKTLSKVGDLNLQPGDRILLAAGEVFYGTLVLENCHGSFDRPILIDTYNAAGKAQHEKAKIDATGNLNGIHVQNSSFIRVRNLEITANGPSGNQSEGNMRVGILIDTKNIGKIENIHFENMDVHDIFYEAKGFTRDAAEVKSANGTQKYGWGIRLIASDPASSIENVLISNSKISNVSHTGIKLTGANQQNIRQIRITNNQIFQTGGPGIQMSGVKYVYVAENEVNYSGSDDDSRKWGRGSGLWTWTSSNVLIEKNRFLNANGPGDSAGAHIDFNCDNIVLQYNFSANNAGGFCEILGNNYNCAYRFNISVNDGHRIKGENGAFQEGKIFWLSGYQGEKKERKGPVNSYFYNNTIYVKSGQTSKIAIDNRSKGILIANNIFHLEGPVEMVSGDQYRPDESSNDSLERIFFENNLFLNDKNWPKDAMARDATPIMGSADFKNPGGLNAEDYIPLNKDLVRKGIEIPLLEGDFFGLTNGLQMVEDFLGNQIGDGVGLGAIMIMDR
ncbi:right-handed parallel beta-helix repeat-containing protein [Aquiflexum sp. TKW24L]|uniref:right-handed parallel beta-helix repeat-containing protein n=1 Tax=Aquiflexum sp. TKW24L TaxID=2942212 RepID=UPI0020BECD74|nr:right-handed parallel beta-helix repeat-containing protein [Aquiflexum sp. TKW24L]MCL6258260.1 right-handed parallel beta-helix repeat-containing protein [Aquiflexum sp. TKW24L]